MTALVQRATSEGVPTEVAFRIASSLDDPSLRWVQWNGESLVPFALPAPGVRVVVPARGHPLLRLPGAPREP
ncbi:MAG: hypothetical protein ACHREM_08885 [Polyangiales bacterium]